MTTVDRALAQETSRVVCLGQVKGERKNEAQVGRLAGAGWGMTMGGPPNHTEDEGEGKIEMHENRTDETTIHGDE